MIFILCIMSTYNIFSQCGTPDGSEMPQPLPECEIGATPKCIKIKFHFVNNADTGASKVPSNQKLSEILSHLNASFGAGNIRFTNAENCLNIIDLPNVKSDSLKWSLIKNKKPETGYPWFYDTTAVNIFFFNKLTSPSHAYGQVDENNEYLAAKIDPKDVTHEMGHIFSLFHTFAFTQYNNVMTWECIGGSATLADMMIDTEADPYNMDFDTIIGPDGVRWGEGCTQDTLLLTKMDRCGKMNWNIPLENPCLIIIAILFFQSANCPLCTIT